MNEQERQDIERELDGLLAKGITPEWLRRAAALFDHDDGIILGEREDGGYDSHSCSREKAAGMRLQADCLEQYLAKQEA